MYPLKIILLVVFVSVAFYLQHLQAQIRQPNRIEIPLGNFENTFEVVNGGNRSIYLFREVFPDTIRHGKQYEVLKLDSLLRNTWTRRYIISDGLIFAKHYYYGGNLHLLFTNSTTGSTDLSLITINTSSGQGTHHQIDNFIPFSMTELVASDYGVLIGGYFNYRPLVLFYDLNTKKTKVLPGFYREKSDLIQVKVNIDKTIDVIISGTTYQHKKANILEIKTFDPHGNLLRSTLLNKVGEKSLLYGRSCEWKGENKLIVGTFGRRKSEYSRGIFLANINRFGEHQINFYNYGEFRNFFSYMRARRQKRVKNRIERRKIKDKRIKFNYRLLVHDIIEQEDQFIMLGEAFYPKYSYPSSATYAGIFQSQSRARTETVFDGYRYTHAVVLGFDHKGNLLWDNSFEITDVKTFERDQFVRVCVQDERIVLLYIYDNIIRSKIIKGGEVLEGKAFDEIQLRFDTDVLEKTKGTTMGGLEKWYGKTFYAYGIQLIKNTGTRVGVETKRKVFYINKVVYQ